MASNDDINISLQTSTRECECCLLHGKPESISAHGDTDEDSKVYRYSLRLDKHIEMPKSVTSLPLKVNMIGGDSEFVVCDLIQEMAEDKGFVSFTCQRCLQPIRLDSSFNYIGEHVLAELLLPVNSNPDVDLDSQTASLDTYIHRFRLSDSNGANGFMLISDTGEAETLSNQVKIRASLFDTLSGCSNIDHPLCDECTDTLLEMLDQQIKLVENDYNDYSDYLKKLESNTQEPELEGLEKELEDLCNEEKRLCDELQAMKLQEAEIMKEIAKQKAESERLTDEEQRYWEEYSKHRREVMISDDDCNSLKNQLQYASSQLTKFQGTNVFNATFHIWYLGCFGTINKFRLGRLTTAPVDWSEINAAWGQTALLVSSLARKMNLTFNKYKIVPFGNLSHIEVLANGNELPLFGSGGIKYFWDSKFDSGMVALVDCVSQIMDKLGNSNKFLLPYKLHPKTGKIEDNTSDACFSVKIQLNSHEQWTKALKFLLTDIKWMNAWVASYKESDAEVQEQSSS